MCTSIEIATDLQCSETTRSDIFIFNLSDVKIVDGVTKLKRVGNYKGKYFDRRPVCIADGEMAAQSFLDAMRRNIDKGMSEAKKEIEVLFQK